MSRISVRKLLWLSITTLAMTLTLPSKLDMQLWMLRFAKHCPGCSLSYVELENLDLRYANLKQADLHGASLTNVDLSYADLSDANLRRAQFNGVVLRETRLCRARLPDPNHPTLSSGNFDCDF